MKPMQFSRSNSSAKRIPDRFPRLLTAVVAGVFAGSLLRGAEFDREKPNAAASTGAQPSTLDLREPMALAAHAIAVRLDRAQNDRPWFKLRGEGGIPVSAEHDTWDFADMTGRYLEGLIFARRMGITDPGLSDAEGRLGRYLLSLLGPDGLVHAADSHAIDHSFSQGSALGGLVAWFEDSGDPVVRAAAERLITGLLSRCQRQGDRLVDPSVKLEQSSGSHLTGYCIYPTIRFYELTHYADALTLAEGLTRWALADPTVAADGTIVKPLSWEGHIHSWLETYAGCVRTARQSRSLDRAGVVARARALYDWVRRTNATSFGWIATFPTHGSSETCALASAMRLALELTKEDQVDYFNDLERFVRNQVVEAQFRDLNAYRDGPRPPTPLLLGCFDSQSMPNGHLGTRGGEDVGNVEGCCLNGGMRALALAWEASQTFDESGVTVNLALTRDGPAARVIGYEPGEGRVDVFPRAPGSVRVRVPDWAISTAITVEVNHAAANWRLMGPFVVLDSVKAGAGVTVRYPLRVLNEHVVAGGQAFEASWKGDVVVGMSPPGRREPTYQNRLRPVTPRSAAAVLGKIPDRYELQDAVRLASQSMWARIDVERDGQPFFRLYPFATPPRAEHDKWDDGDMSGRYVEALILARHMTGIPMDARESLLRDYLAGLFAAKDGLCYTQGTDWTPRRACLFSQSSAMLGLLRWHRETGSPVARRLLDRQADGLMRIAVAQSNHIHFPRYEYDGSQYVDEPKGKEAPLWYGGRVILPLVDYWQLSHREDVRKFLEKLVRYTTEVSTFIKPDGEVERGESWWSHLHGTQDMAAGVCEYGRLTGRRELVDWARRIYDWVGRTQTTRYGFVADVAGGRNCESCAIASRIRLGLALYRAGAATDPFDEIDRHVRNQLLESQFVDLGFFPPGAPATPRTSRTVYAGVDRMVRGTFQCWATANDLIGNEEVEGCGAGGGVQGLALAWDAQCEWRQPPEGAELRVNLLFNRRVRGPAAGPLTTGTPVAAELWSWLPNEGRVALVAHRSLARLALRLPADTDRTAARAIRRPTAEASSGSVKVAMEGTYAIFDSVAAGEWIELEFPLRSATTVDTAAGVQYRVQWKGNAVVSLDPAGAKAPLYAKRQQELREPVDLTAPRYP